ncbi:unnamed protein product [Ilex paraguariensis]|uniref:Uncharacterized protein n=1 Tax=Ilex paraguariensis TaxID=185542 RepID=A0ABC8UVK6_9AQUA
MQSSSTVETDATPTPTVPSPTVSPPSSTSTYESVLSLPLVVDLSLPVEATSIVPPQTSLRHSQPPSQHPMLTCSRDGTRKARTFLATKDPIPRAIQAPILYFDFFISICFVFRARAKPLPCFSPVTSGLAICLSDQLIW